MGVSQRIRVDENGKVEILWPDNTFHQTPYSYTVVELLKKIKGTEYGVWDELLRSEYPDYIHNRLKLLLTPLNLDPGVRILDFGGGRGSSAICLHRLGFRNITTIDIQNHAEVYNLRLSEAGIPSPKFTETDLFVYKPDNKFDVILANGVFEHLNPQRRSDFTDYLFTLLADGGYFLVAETPTIYFPRNSHVGWFYDYLPYDLALRLCYRKFCKDKTLTMEQFVESGRCVRGVSLREITPRNSAYKVMPTPAGVIKQEVAIEKGNRPRSAVGAAVAYTLFYGISALSNVIDANKLLPHFNIVIQKLP